MHKIFSILVDPTKQKEKRETEKHNAQVLSALNLLADEDIPQDIEMASIKMQIEKMMEVLKSKQTNDLMLKKLEALKNEINDHQAKEDGEGSENGGRESKNASKLSHHKSMHN